MEDIRPVRYNLAKASLDLVLPDMWEIGRFHKWSWDERLSIDKGLIESEETGKLIYIPMYAIEFLDRK